MDANHFRNRAAKAREMARAGDDIRLVEMLLEVAFDLEAEAEAIEAEQLGARLTVAEPAGTGAAWLWQAPGRSKELKPLAAAPAAERVT